MPIAPNQNIFPVEECHCHDKPGVLYLTRNSHYVWKCYEGGLSWVTSGSDMDQHNDFVKLLTPDVENLIDNWE